MTAFRSRCSYALTRHFFRSLFDLGFLSDTGSLFFTKLVIGICTLFFSFGLLLTRVYMAKYAGLSSMSSPDPYRQALIADHVFLIALLMWIVALVTTLVSQALFPDETDFRVLMALPVHQRLVFGSKALAVALFTGLFAISIQVASLPPLLLMSVSRWAEHTFIARMAAYYAASFFAAAFAIAVVAVIQGLLVVCVPRNRALAASAALKSVLLAALVLSVPFIIRLPNQTQAFSEGAPWLFVAPPAWFAGLELWFLGGRGEVSVHLAEVAIGAILVAPAVAVVSYALIYRHFDRLILQPGGVKERPADATSRQARFARASSAAPSSRLAFLAMRAFTWITLRRSRLHQGALAMLSAIGAGLAVNSLLAGGLSAWIANRGLPSSRLVNSLIWAPFAAMYVTSRAARMTLMIPLDQRATWLFRMTERAITRAGQLRASLSVVRLVGVIIPVAILLPLQVWVLGRVAIVISVIALLFGSLYVELLMQNWSRLPFACSYVPGKQFVPSMLLKSVGSFILFAGLGTAMTAASLAGHPFAWGFNGLAVGAIVMLRARRLKRWRETPLEFEDASSTDITLLRLGLG